MAYEWEGMRKIPWSSVIEMHENNTLVGCYMLYEDNTEGMIDPNYKWDDIVRHHMSGGEFGLEKEG